MTRANGIDNLPARKGMAHDREPETLPRTFVHRTERGELVLTVPAQHVFLFVWDGYTDGSFPQFIQEVWEREGFGELAHPVQIFVDTSRQTGHTSEFRAGLMRWAKLVLPKSDEYLLLVKSRWIAMGIAIVRSMLGLPAPHVEVTTKRELFAARLEAAVRRARDSLEQAS